MARVTVFLEESIKKQIEEQASREDIPVSKYAAELIRLGLKIKNMKQGVGGQL